MRISSLAVLLTATLAPASARAVGEKVGGFPSYRERVLHQLVNRDRADPQIQLAACGPACSEKDCYGPQPPLQYSEPLNRAARFHADEMAKQGFVAHDSICTLVDDIAADYPDSCDGSAACACVGGVSQCMPVCDTAEERVAKWGALSTGELVAATDDPDTTYLAWLFEDADVIRCGLHPSNANRFLLLQGAEAVGFGVANGHTVGDIGSPGDIHKIASGSHWPRQGPAVQLYASWHDVAAPLQAHVNVDGECIPMLLDRGTPESGAYNVHLDDLSPACHRYFFTFVDSDGVTVTYPTTGSLGIGPEDGCPDFSDVRPTDCGCLPNCEFANCGDDGCGGSCGECGSGTCLEGETGGASCCYPDCDFDQCGPDGCGGSCSECGPGYFCNFDFCQELDEDSSTGDTTGDDTTGDPLTTGDPETTGGSTTADTTTTASTTGDVSAGSGGAEPNDAGCSCRDTDTSSWCLLALLPLFRRRRRGAFRPRSMRAAVRRSPAPGAESCPSACLWRARR